MIHGSRSEGKQREETVCDVDLLERAITFAESTAFEASMNKFKDKCFHLFVEHSESKYPEENQSHELMDAFQEYQHLLEDLFERFFESNKASKEDFYDSCRDVVDGKFTPLFEDHQNKWFVDMILGWMEYENFLHIMCEEAIRRSRAK